jgi:hypothetical protein
MINTFCKLRIEGTDATVAVNPRLVREVREAKTSKDACVIFFDENHTVTVAGTIKYVIVGTGTTRGDISCRLVLKARSAPPTSSGLPQPHGRRAPPHKYRPANVIAKIQARLIPSRITRLTLGVCQIETHAHRGVDSDSPARRRTMERP